MRTSSLKAVVFSITALVLGSALATTPAFAAGGHGGGHGGGFGGPMPATAAGEHGGGGFGSSFPSGGPHGFGGAPSFHGPVVSHGGVSPSWGATHHRHYTPGRRYPRGYGGIVVAPEMCDDYYCDEEYYYDDSDCWFYRPVYNKYGKLLGWRQIYICQEPAP